MNKYEFHNEQKSIIRHNLVPEMLIEIIKLEKQNDYQSADLTFNDIFDEKIIKGWHFVFKIINDEDFEETEDFTFIRSVLKRSAKWYQAKIAMGEILLEKSKPELAAFEDETFKLMKGENNYWICAHKESNFVIEWQNGDFNGTQKISELSEVPETDFMNISFYMRIIGEWLSINHSKIL